MWVDANGDGVTNAGELHGLVDYGIVELNLDYAKGSQVDHGNLLGMVSNYTTADGKQHDMADVWFAKDKAGSAPALGDLLADGSHDLLAGMPAARTGTATHGDAGPDAGTAASVAAAGAANGTNGMGGTDSDTANLLPVAGHSSIARASTEEELLRLQQQNPLI